MSNRIAPYVHERPKVFQMARPRTIGPHISRTSMTEIPIPLGGRQRVSGGAIPGSHSLVHGQRLMWLMRTGISRSGMPGGQLLSGQSLGVVSILFFGTATRARLHQMSRYFEASRAISYKNSSSTSQVSVRESRH